MNVSMRDAHAWPELYFEGVGWTRFEPTPRSGITLPDYGAPEVPAPQPSASSAAPSQSAAAPSAAPSQGEACPPAQKKLGECGGPVAQQSAGSGSGGVAAGTVLAWTALVLLVAAVPLLPLLWRRRVRERRLGSGDVLAAWRELGDCAWDVGIPPDGALSPRGAAGRIVLLGRLEGEAAEAVHRVAGAVERALYAPPGAAGAYAGLTADVLTARSALLAGVGRRSRLRALLLPRSGARLTAAASARLSAASAVVSRLGGRVRLPLRNRG